MDELIVRIVKAVAIGGITFVSTYVITASIKASVALALVPFVLVSVSVFPQVGYFVTVASLLLAVALQVFGSTWVDSALRVVDNIGVNDDGTPPNTDVGAAARLE